MYMQMGGAWWLILCGAAPLLARRFSESRLVVVAQFAKGSRKLVR